MASTRARQSVRSSTRRAGSRGCRTRAQRTPAFHDLLQFHLQGLDGSRWVITGRALDPVNGEFPISRCGNVVVLQEDDPVGVLYDGAGGRETGVIRPCPEQL